MYSPELTRLTARKLEIRARIHQNRMACVASTLRITQPLRWLSQLINLWRDLAPVALAAAVPLSLLFRHSNTPRLKTLRSWTRWVPHHRFDS